MPTTEWLNKYEAIKDKLTCKDDLEAHFTEKVIGNMAVDVLDIGAVHFPTGQIFACDPLVELEDTLPFMQMCIRDRIMKAIRRLYDLCEKGIGL